MKMKWNRKKFLNNIKELMLGTAFFTIPIVASSIYELLCLLFNL